MKLMRTILQAANESQTEILSVNLNCTSCRFSFYYTLIVRLTLFNEKISNLHIKKAINQSDFLELVENYHIIL